MAENSKANENAPGFCPDCGCPESHVVYTRKRVIKQRLRIYRRRECDHCGKRFMTREDRLGSDQK